MRFVETGVVIGKNNKPLIWHEPQNASGGSLPDSRALWEFFLNNWQNIRGFAHSHPNGCSYPSHTDITTFAAIELGLDLRFEWWIVTKDQFSAVNWSTLGVEPHYRVEQFCQRPEWAEELIRRSYK